MKHNALTTIGIGALENYTFNTLLNVYLQNNSIATLQDDFLRGAKADLVLHMQFNHISAAGWPKSWGFEGIGLDIQLANNSMTSVPTSCLAGFIGNGAVVLGLQNNSITSIPTHMFNGYSGVGITSHFQNNQITHIADDAFAGFVGVTVYAYFSGNYLSTLPPGMPQLVHLCYPREVVGCVALDMSGM
eukprot:m.1587403 g.1587403  ORF g.1587403 m.1587403 type:complete len:188 (+) comp25329_c0_seq22:406-969(+)